MKHLLYSFVLCMAISSFSLQALDIGEERVVQQIITQFTDGWNHSSGKEIAEHYSEDADFVNIFGTLFSGKQEIEARHAKILDTFMKGSTFEVTDQRIREVKPGFVIAHVWWKVTNVPTSDRPILKSTMEGIFTHIFVNYPDGWSITSTQNTPIPSKL